MKQRKKSFGMRISAFVLSFAMVCTLLAGVNVVAFAADDNDLIVSVHCFYNDALKGGDGEHLYTKDADEMSWLSGLPTWDDQDEAWKAPVSSSLAVYRVYNSNSGEHHYAAADEAEWLVSQGWTQEKIAFYSDDNKGVPIYRLWNGGEGVGSHYYTTDEGEKDFLVAAYGWKYEGVNFYGVKGEEEKSMTAAQTGANEITVTSVVGEFTGLETFTVSHGDVADELADLEYDEEEDAYVITLANEIEDATYTVTCSDTDFAAVTFEGTSELEILELEATGSKELTATLNRVAELDAEDVIVKKGNVTLTPADVTCVGDTVVITLGSKIVKDTYSVTIENSTASVETEDEKLVEFKTVGTNIAKIDNDTFNPAAYSGNGPAVKTGAQLVAASIEYQALNQYGDPVSAEILQMTNTFGGATVWTEPTAKKNGEIVIYNVPSTLGIQGTEGNLIVVSKSGVSSTCPVTMSEEAKVAMVTPLGIYDNSKETFVEAIPADTTVANRFGLVVDVRDQYGRPMYAKGLIGQTCTAAQTLTNVTCLAAEQGKFMNNENFIADAEMMGQKITVIPLVAKSGANVDANAKATAGSVRLIAVGDRFGTVMDTTVDVANVDLIESFNFSAKDTIYNNYENELDFEAISVSGEEITDYEALSKLVKFDKTTMEWKRNQDGSAKLVYKPAETFTNDDNMKETTVTSVTATCNEDYSKTDLKVVPKTFTVSEDRKAYSVVKYTGDTATANTGMTIDVKKLVIEDQYGNTLSNTETAFTNANLDWQYGTNTDAEYQAATNGTITVLSGKTFATTGAGIKLWVSVSPYARDNKAQINTFNTDKAQLQLTIKKVDSKKVTNLKAEWNPTWNKAAIAAGTAGPQAMVNVNTYQVYSGVDEDMFKVTGTVGGQTITLDPDQYSIKTDTYVPITAEEAETAVKVGMVTMTVQLVDSDNKEYTEDVTAMYQYSAAASAIAGIVNVAELQQIPYYTVTGSVITAAGMPTGSMTNLGLRKMFVIFDQYGNTNGLMTDTNEKNAPSYEITLGDLGTDEATWDVENNNSKTCYLKAGATVADTTADHDFTVTATLANGMTSTILIVADQN